MSDETFWAWQAIRAMAERWVTTKAWHEPPFHDGKINVTTLELHAADIVVTDRLRLASALAASQSDVTRLTAELAESVRALAVSRGEATRYRDVAWRLVQIWDTGGPYAPVVALSAFVSIVRSMLAAPPAPAASPEVTVKENDDASR